MLHLLFKVLYLQQVLLTSVNLLTTIPLLKSRLREPKQIISNSWAERKVILQSDVNLFTWKRPIESQITAYLKKKLNEDPKAISFATDIHSLSSNIGKHRSVWDAENDIDADAFWTDVYRITHDFLSLTDRKAGIVRLKVISDNACAKFHTDGYPLRLFTTYLGKGTEWLTEKATNRKGLGKSNDLIVKNTSKIQQMDTFEVGILKGENPRRRTSTKGIVHRSPEISHLGEKRIILRVDI